MKKVLLFLSLFLMLNSLFSQFQINWQNCYGGSDTDRAFSIIPNNNGYLIIGYTASNDGDISYTHGGSDYWVVQVDSIGNLLWGKTFGGSLSEALYHGFHVYNSTDIYLVGASESIDGDISYDPYNGEANLWVVRITADGDIIWDRKVGSPIGLIYHKYGIPTNDGGVVLAAQADYLGGDISTYYGAYDGWIIKLDENGNTEWDFSLGSSYIEHINTLIQTSDGGYLLAAGGLPQGDGNILCETTNESDAIVFKLDANGNEEWQQCYGGSEDDNIYALLELDNGYLYSAITESYDGDLVGAGFHGGGENKYDIWIVRADFEGNIIWSKCYGGTHSESAYNLFKTTDGGFMIFGHTESKNGDVSNNPSYAYSPSVWIFKIDSLGALIWEQCIGGGGTDRLHEGVYRKNENNFILAVDSRTQSPSGDFECVNETGNDNREDFWVFEISDTTTVNIAESINHVHKLKAYPNPAQNYVVLELPPNTKKSKLYITNIYGEMISELQILPQQSQLRWNCENILSGVYFYQTEIGGVVYRGKVLINK